MGNLTLQNKQTNKHTVKHNLQLSNWSLKIFLLPYIISLLWFELCMLSCEKFEMLIEYID